MSERPDFSDAAAALMKRYTSLGERQYTAEAERDRYAGEVQSIVKERLSIEAALRELGCWR